MDSNLRDLFDRYGPTLALIATIVLLVALLPSNAKSKAKTVSAGDTNAGASAGNASLQSEAAANQAAAGTPGATAAATPTGAAAPGAATPGPAAAKPAAGAAPTPGAPGAPGGPAANCRTLDGRQSGISTYMPPCAQFDGNNFGATATGVFPDHIKVAFYVPKPNPATEAALKAAGAQDDYPDIRRIIEVLRHYYNDHYQTYGREVQFVEVDGQSDGSDDVAAKADADQIANAGFFAAFTARGTSTSPTFDRRLASRGVICVACSVTQANSFYDATKGLNFGALPTARQYYENIAEYWGKRLVGNGRVAKFAGQPVPARTDLRTKPRKFGLIWLNANMGVVDPGAQEERDHFIKELLPKYGITGVIDSNYNFDVSAGPTEAQTIIAKMNSNDVTTIAMIADPIFPVYFTKEASNEQYFPEWFQTGTALTDTTFFGRTYDSQQWAHGFGISPLWVFFQHFEVSDGYREYHHACPQLFADQSNCAAGKEGVGVNVYRTALLELFTGVQMAGPKLTPQSFAKGQYDYPATGGTPAYPLWKTTPDSPVFIKDFTETWWNGTGSGMDEVNKNGVGILMKTNGGKRYLENQWPTTDPNVFDPNGAVFTSDAPYTGPNAPKHEQDGHTHPGNEKCLSCKNP